MPELQFADGVLARLNAHGERSYDERAYLFVLAAIEQIQTTLPMRRHVSGQELAWSCRDLALARFGLLARTVLDCWGVRSTADFGHLVYAMVEVGLLSTQPGDTVEDFNEVFDFETAFVKEA
ncbi:MAG: hypothetical protein SFU57_04355 [Gemmatimonadales bacterium]|nr:hypothetical protein [Gemmatimonadales bacterium]MDZ4257202.1 Minf_1886 family protein [Gemmatimonadales bacterium]MDZ4390426.1 Minf_1886 family protein [Gemmatimonadales bacterium]